MKRRTFLLSFGAVGVAACDGTGSQPRPSSSPGASPPPTSAASPAAPVPSQAATPTAAPTPAPRLHPIGFPIDPATRLGIVSGESGAHAIGWGEGPTALEYSRDDQPADDPDCANRCGWNARLHVEYEGQPAVDWYIPIGTPVYATMDGTVSLMINTVSNPFDTWGVSREPYLGNPDRARAPIVPFPGPGGGMGVFIRIRNTAFQTEMGHLDLVATSAAVPPQAWVGGLGADTGFASRFREIRDFRVADLAASWDVRAGDLVGLSGDSGYSEAPHLHYTIRRAGSADLLCPTAEPGFDDAGWLLRAP
ncbi:MAG: hypothetical protein AMXMBFR80_29150 [Dehalococcoidia bacterium]